MVKEDLATRFKDPDDPFRLVFVCAMWMTGFDAPACSTIYLDKPMRNHTLMQTIARANRVFGDKVNGLIVDYIGVFRNLQRALAVYGSAAGGGVAPGDLPVQAKAALVAQLGQAIAAATAHCIGMGVDLAAIQSAPDEFRRLARLDDAVDALIANDAAKLRYLSLAGDVARLYRAILPDPAANQYNAQRALFAVLADKIRALAPVPDISGVLGKVNDLLDESIKLDGYVIRAATAGVQEQGGKARSCARPEQAGPGRAATAFCPGPQTHGGRKAARRARMSDWRAWCASIAAAWTTCGSSRP